HICVSTLTATTDISILSLHDALPIWAQRAIHAQTGDATGTSLYGFNGVTIRNNIVANCQLGIQFDGATGQPATYGSIYNNTIYKDRKSTRLNSSHDQISYAVFCLKKK